MSRRGAGLLALLMSVPGWITILALAALREISPGSALLGGLVVLLLAIGVAQYLANDVAGMGRWLRGSRESETKLPAPKVNLLGDLVGDAQSLERHWRQRYAEQARHVGDSLAILDNLPDPLLTLDDRAFVVFANTAARQLLTSDGVAEDPAGRALSSLLRQPGLLSAIDQVIDGAPGQEIELTLTGKVDRFVEAWVEPLTEAAGASGVEVPGARVLLVIRDMTAVRRGEGVRANFVANVSHELRTPLASLLGFIETLRGPAADDREAQTRFLGMMDEQAARMARLVDDLLSLSRIEMNEHQPLAERVVLPVLLQTTVDLLAPQADQKQVTVTVSAAPDLPAVQGDPDDLARLFQNLIENAIKYGRESSAVTVGAEADDNRVMVTVADEGEGIAPEHLPRLTERFYRVDAARSRALGGTGLGLAIVKHIANRHRGDLKVESEVGVGSRFIITLPVPGPVPDPVPGPKTE